MSATESKTFKNFTGNTAEFTLKGGRYGIAFNATGAGAASLNMLGADLSTLIPVETSITATPNYQTADLPPGEYVFVTTGFTGANVSVTSVPL